jgi:hypothetical protein
MSFNGHRQDELPWPGNWLNESNQWKRKGGNHPKVLLAD